MRKLYGRKRFIMSANDNTNGKKPEEEAKALSFEKGKKKAAAAAEKKQSALKQGPRVTIGWILGIIILVLIAISFVLAPAIDAFLGKRSSSGIVFGQYGKEEIKYAYGNFFYDQVQNYADQYKGSQLDQTQALFQIWKSAYDSTVLHTAISQIASKAGIIATDKAVNRAIIESGAYHKDGKFDVQTYQKASVERRSSIEQSIRRSLPYQMVLNDVQSVLSSSAEAQYIADMAASGRTFNYLVIDPSLYPDVLASQFALENKQLFYNMDLSIISVASLEEAQEIQQSIASGSTTFEEAAASFSLDSFSSAEGRVGELFYYGVLSNFKNPDEALALLTAKNNEVVGPFEAEGSFALYQINRAAVEPDYASAATLSAVKRYLANNEPAIIESYLAELAQDISALARADGLLEAALAYDLELVEVPATPFNLGQSAYMSDFSNTDSTGLLATAATGDTARLLFTEQPNTVLDPIKAGVNFLLIETGEDVKDEGMASYISMFYNYYSGSQNQQDLSEALYTSDAFKDNFFTTFLTVILGESV